LGLIYTPLSTSNKLLACKSQHKIRNVTIFISFLVALRPNAGCGFLIHEISRSHTTTHHSRYDSSGLVISSSQRPLPDKTQHSQQTEILAPWGFRTHDLSRGAPADLCVRPRDHASCI